MIFTYPIELFRSLCNSFSKPDGNEYLRQWLQKLVPNYEVFDTRPVGKQTRLPVYGNVSAGKGCYTDTDVVAWEVADEKYDSDEYFYLLVTGDSMSPDIKDGDYALVHSQDYIESGQIGVCVVDDEGFIKRIEYGEDSLTLVSINPYYPPRKFEKYDMNNVHIIGRVIETKRKY